jgi:hypothetical protein
VLFIVHPGYVLLTLSILYFIRGKQCFGPPCGEQPLRVRSRGRRSSIKMNGGLTNCQYGTALDMCLARLVLFYFVNKKCQWLTNVYNMYRNKRQRQCLSFCRVYCGFNRQVGSNADSYFIIDSLISLTVTSVLSEGVGWSYAWAIIWDHRVPSDRSLATKESYLVSHRAS